MPPVTIIYPSLRGQPLNSEDVTNAVEIGIGADSGAQAAIAEAIFDDITTNVNFPAEVVNAVEAGIGADPGAQDAITVAISNRPSFSTRAAAIAATVPIEVKAISLNHSNKLLDYIEDAGGTALTTNGGARKWSPASQVTPLHWGAEGYAITDDYAALQAAVTWVGSAKPYRGGVLELLDRRYSCSDRIIISNRGVIVRGVSFSASGTNDSPSQIIGNHNLGEVILRNSSDIILEHFTISSSAARWTPAASGAGAENGTGYGRTGSNGRPNVGLRTEGPDVSGGAGYVQRNGTEGLTIRSQPSHAKVDIGENSGSWDDNIKIEACNGHGLIFSAGEEFGRTNASPPGIVNVFNARSRDCAGHGLVIGHPTMTVAIPYRINLDNFEEFNCATDATILHENADCFVLGQNCVIRNSGIGAVGKASISYGGRNNTFENNRYFFLHSAGALIQKKYAIDATRGNKIIGGALFARDASNVSVASCAFVCDDSSASATPPYIDMRTENSGTEVYTNLLSTGGRSAWTHDNSKTKTGSHIFSAGFTSSPPIEIANGAIFSFDMAATGSGILAISTTSTETASALIHYRVGSSQFCSIIAGGADVEVKTIALASFSDGTNSKLTVSAFSDNKLYILNRLGAAKFVVLTLLSPNSNQRIPWSVLNP
jgi:hypothetical protein